MQGSIPAQDAGIYSGAGCRDLFRCRMQGSIPVQDAGVYSGKEYFLYTDCVLNYNNNRIYVRIMPRALNILMP
jgi:hypothetical protein